MVTVLDLAAAGSSSIDLVGGKALNLGVMIAAGLPVPAGFCVTTTAYRAVVGGAVDRAQISRLVLPDELCKTIVAGYRSLGADVAVAVRSSATAEDLAYASFAGQQDTYLNVVGDDDLIDAVRRCWASLWSERAVSYRAAQGIDPRTVALAVVVQVMVDARVAGVMFTANPVTGTRHQSVVDASPGLGEAVVSGAVNPDHFVIDRSTGAVVEQRLADPAGACLDAAELVALTRLGQQVQDLYGAPQDTEWAIGADGTLWLTQARSVTTLYPVPKPPPSELRTYLCLTLAQGLTRPITPMGLAVFRLLGSSVATAAGFPPAEAEVGPAGLHVLAGRIFVDVTPVLRQRQRRRLMLAALSVMEARAALVLRQLGERPEFSYRPETAPRALRPAVRVLLRAAAPPRFVAALASPAHARPALGRIERRLRASLVVPAGASHEERLDLVRLRLGHDIFLLMPTCFAYAAAGFASLALARRLLRGLAQPAEFQAVLRSLPHNVTTAMDLELWALAGRIRSDPASRAAVTTGEIAEVAAAYRGQQLPPVAQHGLEAFLARYGHRSVAEIDLGMPRWADDPGHLIGVLRNYLQLEDAAVDPETQFRAGERLADAAIIDLVARARQRSRLRGRVVGWALRRTRELAGLRETPKFLLVLALSAMRTQLGQIGVALQADDRVENADDVFFLDFADVRRGLAGADLRERVVGRRTAYAVELGRRRIPRLLLSDGTEPEALATLAELPDGALIGSPASVGTVTGTARVILDPSGAHLEPGEILVAPSTDPGWTPLFLTAGGLVMEMGGSNSHGAVVAREYGIPAVVGVADATHVIHTGDRITVDGASGLVTPVGLVAPE
ncbi:MAG TPA: PEP/pyruvate-binding domain-containing protein [Propionibacteriaceae bacterium]